MKEECYPTWSQRRRFEGKRWEIPG